MAAEGHVIFVISSNESFVISKIMLKFHSNMLDGSGDTLY